MAILLLGVHLLTSTELFELVKMPMLVLHYIEHREINKSETLFDFLHSHYADCDNHQQDIEHQHKLPFKSHEGCVNLNILIGIPAHYDNILQTPLSEQQAVLLSSVPHFISNAFLASIWQPPKFA